MIENELNVAIVHRSVSVPAKRIRSRENLRHSAKIRLLVVAAKELVVVNTCLIWQTKLSYCDTDAELFMIIC